MSSLMLLCILLALLLFHTFILQSLESMCENQKPLSSLIKANCFISAFSLPPRRPEAGSTVELESKNFLLSLERRASRPSCQSCAALPALPCGLSWGFCGLRWLTSSRPLCLLPPAATGGFSAGEDVAGGGTGVSTTPHQDLTHFIDSFYEERCWCCIAAVI